MKKIIFIMVFALTAITTNAKTVVETTDCHQYAVDAVEAEMSHYNVNYNYYEYSQAISDYEDACVVSNFLGEIMFMPIFLN